ncbi:S8 family serine peptidase [Cellulomonas sp. APG4]|uniref:S8 family serine peptidase n=1 Tax=Cellulomonas sp. APG4 TaxID=1538656 RepID=UPI00137ABEEC|nr:S8 family serine peptidase [Cellulomonas sp. APG4]NCT92178.1 S8 family serine peptidase [Cellulomonas sp. APG4]
MSRRRPVLAAVTSLALAVPLSIAAAGAAGAAPPDDAAGLPVEDGEGLERPGGLEGRVEERWGGEAGKVSPALMEAEGHVTAFVELEAPSGVETAEAGGDAADVEQAAAEVEELAEQVVPDTSNQRTAQATPQRLSVTTNLVAGMVVSGDATRLRALAGEDDVKAVHLVVPKKPANKGTDVFTRALEAWQATGRTGDGVTIGVIDTGVDYTHADFGGPGTAEAYAEAYGENGTGPVPEDLLDPEKYLGGYDFAGPDYNAAVAGSVPTPDANPIDAPDTSANGGHGTHVAGSAAGYGVLEDGTTFDGDYASLTDISDWKIGPGTAPLAGVYALKVFGDVGGSTGLVIDALEWAADPNGDFDFNDRLDIVNLSLGSDHSPADDPENLFIDRLSALGVLSVIASGNAGDVTDIGGSPGNARSALTVANSVADTQTYDAVEVTAAPDDALLGLHPAQNSVNYTGTDDVTAPVVYLGDGIDGCTSLEEHADVIDGNIVWLYWDDNDSTRACGSTVRWNNAEAAGAVGVLIGTEEPVFPAGIAGNANVPGAQLTADATDTLLPAIQAGGVEVHLGPSLANAAFVSNPELGDTLNDGSSRGVHGSLGIVKPDVAAPGTLISSSASGTGDGASTKTGTSMATPHVAGIAALVAEANPGWNPAQVKAAVMNTATHDVFSELGQTGPVYGPERVGSGRVDALQAAETEVLAWATDDTDLVSVAFGVVEVGAETVVERRTVTVTNTGNRSKRFDTSFAQATSAGGATVTTTPASLTVPAGDSRTVTLTLTVDPATLERELDPTSEPTYDLGIPVPRDYVATISGRLVLTPSGGDDPALRVPVHAAPRPVSELSAEPVTFPAEAQEAPLTLTGRGVDGGGWTSLVAPFTLMASSPQLEDVPDTGTSESSIRAADLRHIGFASTAPQLAAAGDPEAGSGTIGIGIATEGEWASLGTNVVPIIDTDVDGDGIWDLETYVWKYGPELDFTTVETYALEHDAETGAYELGDLLDLAPVNGLWADLDTTVFDNDVVVAPINIDAVGIEAGDTPRFTVATYSPYAPDASGIVDEAEPFTADPFAPPYWFDGGEGTEDSLWFLGAPGEAFTVHRTAEATQDLLLLHTRNVDGERAQVVDVTVTEPEPEPELDASHLAVVAPTSFPRGLPVPVAVVVRSEGGEPTGTVEVSEGGEVIASAKVHTYRRLGFATVLLPRDLATGAHALTITYTGNDVVAPSSAEHTLTITKGLFRR